MRLQRSGFRLHVFLISMVGVFPVLAQGPEASETPEAVAHEEQQTNSGPSQERELAPKELPNPFRDPRDRVFYPGDTEKFKPLVEKLGGNLLLDQKEIWTSPFHMHTQDAKWWLGFGAATAALIATDRDSALHPNPSQVSWSNGVSNIGTSYTLVPLVAGFYGYGVLRDNPKAREVGVLGTEALLDSLIVVAVLKPITGRNRPDAQHEPSHFFDGGSSFPSGHAIQAWTVASVLSYEYGHTKVVPVVAIGLAAVVSTARFTAQKHYASDIVAGGAMGWFIGRYVWKTHQDHAIHPHGGFRPAVVPQIAPGSGTYGISLQFETGP
jgi:membrane-associated phospholipid phosphatase